MKIEIYYRTAFSGGVGHTEVDLIENPEKFDIAEKGLWIENPEKFETTKKDLLLKEGNKRIFYPYISIVKVTIFD